MKGEEIVALVDTGSALTLVSKACYDRLARKLGTLELKETNVRIMGIAGLSRNCEGRIENVPIKFSKKEWELNADIIHHPTVDMVLGQNFLTKVLKATLNLPKLQMILSNGEIIQLYREPSRTISLCLMAKVKKKQPQWKPHWKPKEEKPIPKSEWQCKIGPKEQTCIKWTCYEEDPEPCSKCADKYWEKMDYDEKKQWYEEEKYNAHALGWRSYSDGTKSQGQVLAEDYDLYVKGSQLKMNGEVVLKGKALGYVGASWTTYHPEAKQEREKAPGYEWRSEKWKPFFQTSTDRATDDAMKLWHEKHNPESDQMEIDYPLAEKDGEDMAIDNPVKYVECFNVQNHKDHRKLPVQEIADGVVIGTDQWTWQEIQRVQARFTQEPRGNQLPYHWKGPNHRCWHKTVLANNETCNHCITDLQAMNVIAKLPDKTLERWEQDGKIKARKRLLPVQPKSPRFPTAWQQFSRLEARRWNETARIPKEQNDSYTLYASQDRNMKGLELIATDIEIRVKNGYAMTLEPIEGEHRFLVQNQTLTSEHRISVLTMTPQQVRIKKGDPIAQLRTLPGLLKQPDMVLVGQKIETTPAPYTQNITPEQKAKLDQLLKDYESVFAKDLNDLGQATIIEHKIDTGNARPNRPPPPNRYTWSNGDFIEAEVERMLNAGIIEKLDIDALEQPARSNAWVSPVVVVQKKNGSLRFCVDYRQLNAVTVPNRHPFPIMDDVIANISKGGKQPQIFSALDLASGYWQVKVEKDSQLKTAFTCHKGLFYFKRLPFGLKNAPVSFQNMMETIFTQEIGNHLAIYIDDINVYSLDFDQHLIHLKNVLEKCKRYGLKLKREKCKFACEELEFLGHIVSKEGLAPDDRKIKAIAEYPAPTNVKEIQSLLGMTNFYRQFIQDYSEITSPITELLKKKVPFNWSNECQDAFETLKHCLIESPILIMPNDQDQFTLMTDASDFALGVVLAQDRNGTDYVVSYASKKLNPTQCRYHINEKEGMAVVWAVHKKYRRYLHGRHFRVITDSKTVKSMISKTEPISMRVARWVMILQEYDFEIIHREGTWNTLADGLSRNPKYQTKRT